MYHNIFNNIFTLITCKGFLANIVYKKQNIVNNDQQL